MGMMIDMVPDEHDQLLHCIETDIKAMQGPSVPITEELNLRCKYKGLWSVVKAKNILKTHKLLWQEM